MKSEQRVIVVLLCFLVISVSANCWQVYEAVKLKRQVDNQYEEILESWYIIYLLNKQIGKYPYLELFTRQWFANKTVYCVAESKQGWLNGTCPLLFQSVSFSSALQWASDHVTNTVIVGETIQIGD